MFEDQLLNVLVVVKLIQGDLMKKWVPSIAVIAGIALVGCESPLGFNENEISKTENEERAYTNHVVAIAYEHTGFKGRSYPIYSDWANYQLRKLPSEWNDEISSVKIIDKDYNFEFYEHNYGPLGKMTELNTRVISQLDWGDFDNDTFSGFKVYKDTKEDVWYRLWDDANYKGAYVERYSDEEYANIGSLWNDRISSIEILGPASFGAYEHADYKGDFKWFTSSTPYVGDDWNDKITSHINDAVGVK